MRRLSVLISGAGIAGCTLAYWLARYGHFVTVVERSGAVRSSGAPVDVRGGAVQVVEQMNIAPRLREARCRVTGLILLDHAGNTSARVDLEGLWQSIDKGHIELPRGDLAKILYEATRDSAEFIFGDSIASLADHDGAGVEVAFEHSGPRRFDLVIGADGLHSNVRRLAFGSESSFVRHAGLYVATLPLSRSIDPGYDLLMLNTPGRCVAIHPSREIPLGVLVFWNPENRGIDYSDSEQHKRIVRAAFTGIGWKVPEVLDAVDMSRDLFFDAVSRADVANWARGRVALLGDAASCVSLFGDGTSLAICGAYALANALAEHPTDHHEAFRQYQANHMRLVGPRQKHLTFVASLLVPRTQWGLSLRNRLFSMALPLIAVLKLLSRRLQLQ